MKQRRLVAAILFGCLATLPWLLASIVFVRDLRATGWRHYVVKLLMAPFLPAELLPVSSDMQAVLGLTSVFWGAALVAYLLGGVTLRVPRKVGQPRRRLSP